MVETARLENHIVQELLIYAALYKAKWLRQYRPTPFKITVETVTYTCTDAETGEHEVVDRQWRVDSVDVSFHLVKIRIQYEYQAIFVSGPASNYNEWDIEVLKCDASTADVENQAGWIARDKAMTDRMDGYTCVIIFDDHGFTGERAWITQARGCFLARVRAMTDVSSVTAFNIFLSFYHPRIAVSATP
ncbi:hypothetical protein ARMSODRAFT_1026577 [Armillaria solidipes]|uniref:Uncharacterized protein n=1 Tax=Armillaria solidipes TaxID=1076256 RepID=A0A2H3B722_9AGAR|nr:hypothetical protein ARMSODRAFT_1026577 [Armillaria solidipes]